MRTSRGTEDLERRRSKRSPAGLSGAGGLILAIGLAGCNDLQTISPFEMETDPARIYASLTLDHGAVNLSTAAPYDTLRLTATPLNALGDPIEGLPEATFTSSDTMSVWVTADGRLEARRPASGVLIIAELTSDVNIRHADTVRVNVTANPAPPKLSEFSIDTESINPKAWGLVSSQALHPWMLLQMLGLVDVPAVTVKALDDLGNPIPQLAIEYESLDREVALVDKWSGMAVVASGFLAIPALRRPGEVRIVARTTAFGVSMADTVVVNVTLPVVNGTWIEGNAEMTPKLVPAEVTILRNGYVGWVNNANVAVELQFDDPTNVAEATTVCMFLGPAFCGGGNIPVWGEAPKDDSEVFRYRQFPVPGIYTYRVTGDGIDITGRVVVLDEE